jgi:hypothetical protein
MKKSFSIFVLLFLIFETTNAKENQAYWSEKLFYSVSYAKNGNDPAFDVKKAKKSLENGANPNWINNQSDVNYEKTSILSHFVFFASLDSRNHEANEGYTLVKLLFEHGAKIQKQTDSDILFRPIANGNYNLTEILLKNGVSAKQWPRSIGTALSPAKYAAKEGFVNIVKLLVNYGARPVEVIEVTQLRFIEIAGSGSFEELKIFLKENKVNVNFQNKDERTALLNTII